MDNQSRLSAKKIKPVDKIREPALGETIDGFFLKEILSEQPENNLFRVTHPQHDLPMVMKAPRLRAFLPAEAFTAFESEMRILSRLRGANTPRIIAKGDLSSCPYFVMEYVEGMMLSQAVERAPVTVDELAQLMIPVCKAVHELHRHNIVHLDIKPGNIRNRNDGRTVVLDFGTAHHSDFPDQYNDPHKKAPRSFDYVAPEQLRGIRNDSRSDVYALGIILYQLATGELPFGKANYITVNKRLYLPPTPPRAVKNDVPAWLQEVILKCIERMPDDRFSSAKQLAYVLTHPSMVTLSNRAELTKNASYISIARSWLQSRQDNYHKSTQLKPHERIVSAPHVLVAVDLDNTSDELQLALRNTIQRLANTDRQSFFTIMTIVEKKDISGADNVTEIKAKEHPAHIQYQAELRIWMKPLKIPASRVNYQVIEGQIANEIIAYSKYHVIDNVVIGARGSSTIRRFMGSVSTRVVAESPCTVTVVRTRRDNQNITN